MAPHPHRTPPAQPTTSTSTPDGPAPVGRSTAPPAERETGAAASVLLCPTAPDAGRWAQFAAALPALITAYTDPGDRVLLAPTPGPDDSRPNTDADERDRLVETVLRLGRGATTHATPDAPRSPRSDTRPQPESETGPGLRPATRSAPGPTAPPDSPSPVSDRFALIVLGDPTTPQRHGHLAELAPQLDADGTLVVLTHSDEPGWFCTGRFRRRAHTRGAVRDGLVLTDRLIIAHEHPDPSPPANPSERRAVAEHGHRPAHSTAFVFRPRPTRQGGR
ncbi:hypothetical protein GIY23_13010 [Allosaccharopolyspora coralli]|uniref:Uncharacterized protein n=1 Tax=Allosaccharopolyspora coralli TaxID=2665642 RepID=A0A5Q3Q915_9PSEU|nr:hypothetical protein [Allosaccharopolyspora coralli]QGK70320.1 hypothetical protein GIY23_13010 [Allosaccharopolyspora coralli]